MEPGRARNAVSQLRKGTLEYCVLALLRDGQRYGFELVRTLSQADGLIGRNVSFTDATGASVSGKIASVSINTDGTVATLDDGTKVQVGPGLTLS